MGLGEDSNSAMYILGVCVGVSVDGVDSDSGSGDGVGNGVHSDVLSTFASVLCAGYVLDM